MKFENSTFDFHGAVLHACVLERAALPLRLQFVFP